MTVLVVRIKWRDCSDCNGYRKSNVGIVPIVVGIVMLKSTVLIVVTIVILVVLDVPIIWF